jgi:hypothetical protein
MVGGRAALLPWATTDAFKCSGGGPPPLQAMHLRISCCSNVACVRPGTRRKNCWLLLRRATLRPASWQLLLIQTAPARLAAPHAAMSRQKVTLQAWAPQQASWRCLLKGCPPVQFMGAPAESGAGRAGAPGAVLSVLARVQERP